MFEFLFSLFALAVFVLVALPYLQRSDLKQFDDRTKRNQSRVIPDFALSGGDGRPI